jgi:hypothetical protein
MQCLQLNLEVNLIVKNELKRFFANSSENILNEQSYLEMDPQVFPTVAEMLVTTNNGDTVQEAVHHWIAHDEEQRSCHTQTLLEIVERAIKINLPTQRKPKASYFLFCDEYRDQVSRELNSQNAAQVSKELGQRWKNLSEQQKETYDSMFKKLREKYDAEIIEYNNFHPEGTLFTGFTGEPYVP